MKIIYDVAGFSMKDKSIVAIGNFDGVHIGHQKLLETFMKEAKISNLNAIIYTFLNNTHSNIKLIYSNEYKNEIISAYNAEYLLEQQFDETFSNMSPDEFINEILINKLNAAKVVVGFNFRFGKKATGDIDYLKNVLDKKNIELIVIDKVKVGDNIVSSTLIRQLIKEGQVEDIPQCLGRDFSVKGEVIKGRQVGRQLGFPTANLNTLEGSNNSFSQNQIMLPNGVYETITEIDNKWHVGLTNVGFNPTFELKKLSIENYLLNFNEEIYGKIITIKFVKKIRDEIKFKSVNQLIEQLNKDKKYLQIKFDMI